MTMFASTVPAPIYRWGWIIQPTPEGFEVYPRTDTYRNKSEFFPTIGEAFNYVDDQAERG